MARRTKTKLSSSPISRTSPSSPEFESRRKRRFLFLCTVVLIGCAAVLLRAALLQVFPNQRLKQLASSQFQKMIRLNPRRGVIEDKEGRTLALSVEKHSIYVMKNDLVSAKKTARRLSALLRVSEQALLKRLQSKGNFQWVARKVEQETAEKIQSLKLPGVGVVREFKRVYPQGSLAAPVLGFVNIDGQGLEGVERQYESLLKGEPEKIITLRDGLGRPIFLKNNASADAKEGYRLSLTLDSKLQFLSEKFLNEALKEFNASEGSVIMMDPKTGAILVMATSPAFDPNRYSLSPIAHRRNRTTTDMFEPGSTFKPFTVAAALEYGVMRPEERIDTERGRFRIGGHTIHEAHEDKVPKGPIDARETLVQSNNVVSAKLALRLGTDRFLSYLARVGFGLKAGIDLPGEAVGIMQPVEKLKGVNLATVGFGQGIAITPLQLVRAYAALANGGYLVTPYLVNKVTNAEQEIIYERKAPAKPTRAINANIAKQISHWLEGVTEPTGTGNYAAIPGIRVAGKTGTAQRIDPVKGGYLKGSYVASFIGFAPAEDPQFLLLVSIHNPKPVYFGSLVAAPVWKKIATATLQLPGTEVAETPVKNQEQELPSETLNTLLQRESKTTTLSLGSEMETVNAPPSLESMPTLTGLSLREALNRLPGLRQRLRVRGTGRVVSQSPPPQSRVNSGTNVSLVLESAE